MFSNRLLFCFISFQIISELGSLAIQSWLVLVIGSINCRAVDTRSGMARVEHAWAVTEMIYKDMHQNPYPTHIIVHVGTNNIFKESISQIRKELLKALNNIRQLLPLSTIIWSDILPRLAYNEE